MDSKTTDEQIFMLEVLIYQVSLNDESLGTAEEPLRIRIKFIDYPCFEINQQEFANNTGDAKNFDAGKSCMFAMVPVELIRSLQRYPLAVSVYQVKEDVPVPDIIGQTRIRMTDGIMEAVQTVMNCNCDTDLPVSYTLKDTYPLYNAGGEIGNIRMLVTLSCCGRSIMTEFQMKGEKKTFLFKSSKNDKTFPCKKDDPPSNSKEDPAKYDILQASPFVSSDETAFDCGSEAGAANATVAWKMPKTSADCDSPCNTAVPVCPDECSCPCEEEPQTCVHKKKPVNGKLNQGKPNQGKQDSSEEAKSCEGGLQERDQNNPQSAWVAADCPYEGPQHKNVSKIRESNSNSTNASSCCCAKQPEIELEEDDCACGFEDGDVASLKGVASVKGYCGGGGGGDSATRQPSAGEGDGGSNTQGVSSSSIRFPKKSKTSAIQKITEKKKNTQKKVVISGTKKSKKKKKTKFSYKWGLQYPGVKVGHQGCVIPSCQVPPHMGWMWKAPRNNASCPGVVKQCKGWKPGAVSLAISKMINEHRIAAGKTPNNIAPKSRFKKGRLNAEGGEMPTAPTLHVHRKDGAYYISMHPLDIGGDSEQVPLEFKIPKQKNDDGDSESTESDLEIEFMAPGAFEPKKAPPVFRSFGTQYLAKDVAHLIEAKPVDTLQLNKDKKNAGEVEKKAPPPPSKKKK